MLPKINPTKTSAWKSLKDHHLVIKPVHLSDLFRRNPVGAKNFSPFSEVMEEGKNER
jgi:hypothetical protein